MPSEHVYLVARLRISDTDSLVSTAKDHELAIP
jgi:hypothetical protein